jgi:hypothetical protein
VSGTADNVHAFCTLAVADNTVTLTPASIWLDESRMSGIDKVILNKMLQQVLIKLQHMLHCLQIPPLSFTQEGITVDLTPPVAAIVSAKLVAAACLKSNGSPDIGGATWPDKALFALVSGSAITSIAQGALNTKLVNKEFNRDGSVAGGTAKWDATAKCTSATLTSDATDRTKVTAQIGFGLSAELKPLGIGGPCSIGAATSGM